MTAPPTPSGELSPWWLVHEMVPFATQLVGTVHDFPPEETAKLLAEIPDGRVDALVVVLAAMVPTDRNPFDLLSWVTSEHLLIGTGGTTRVIDCGTPEGYDKHCREGTPKDPACQAAHARRRPRPSRDSAARRSNRNVA